MGRRAEIAVAARRAAEQHFAPDGVARDLDAHLQAAVVAARRAPVT